MTKTSFASILIAGVFAASLTAAPMYQQDFFYDGDNANRPTIPSITGWDIFYSGTGASVTNRAFSFGNPTAAVSQDASPATAFDGGTNGVAFFYYGTENEARAFLMTHTLETAVAQNTPNLAFDWWYGTQDTQGNVRLAVEIGGNWYLNTTNFSSTTSTATAQMVSQGQNANVVFDPNAANWADFSFTENSSFDVLSSVTARGSDLPTGDITAFGIYSYNPNTTLNSNNNRFNGTSIDSVQVIPEPSALALVGVALLSCALIRRRARRG
jgi:hypothetical protein